jgi:hypothetical protein
VGLRNDSPASSCTAGTPATKPHAVQQAGGNTYSYDCNGNPSAWLRAGMVGRTVGATSYTLSDDAENRLTGVSGAATAIFVYDGRTCRFDCAQGRLRAQSKEQAGEGDLWDDDDSLSRRTLRMDGQHKHEQEVLLCQWAAGGDAGGRDAFVAAERPPIRCAQGKPEQHGRDGEWQRRTHGRAVVQVRPPVDGSNHKGMLSP